MNRWFLLALALLVMNALCFLAWAIDKERARRRTLRISEQTLLLLAACGGLGGAILGQIYFRHKTNKRSFNNALWAIAMVEIIALFWFVNFYTDLLPH